VNKTEMTATLSDGRQVRFETGRMAKQAAGSAVVQMGDAMLLCTMCYGADMGNQGFFPLTVEYREKAYAAGRIPGGYFKREAKPTDEEVLTSRLIDRPIRPMFPDGFQREVQIIATVISADQNNPVDVLGVSAASLSVGLSDIPFEEQVAAVRVIKLGDEFIVNPSYEQIEQADLEMVMAGTETSVTMVEGGAYEVSEADVVKAISVGHEEVKKLCRVQAELVAKAGKAKFEFAAPARDEELFAKVESLVVDKLRETFHVDMVKSQHYPAMDAMKQELLAQFDEETVAEKGELIKEYFGAIEKREMREMILNEGRRIDGRKTTEIRPITIETSVLPSVHGSALFQRGETLSLATTTLGSPADVQHIESIKGDSTKTYMLHYNFPPFCVGECKRLGSLSRREVGHGHLAERSLAPVLPCPDDFPYTIRVVSDILESNGSSSMASVCGGCLSLMDAGVPIKSPVAGIAMGLITDGDRLKVLSDITGTEDHLGDMDFKVTGTKDGITGFQMDIKVKGITLQIMTDALEQARQGRAHILGKMAEALPGPRPQLSPKAPSIVSFRINPARIKDVIGPGGSVIRGIQANTGASVNVVDDGTVTVAAPNQKAGQMARSMIEELVAEAEVGKVYKGKVKSIVQFGAFVEILPGKDGLVHISEMADHRVEKVEDVLNIGDEVEVKCIGIDPRGKVKLSMKALLPGQEG